MSKTKSGGGFSSLVASLAIVIAVVIGVLVFKFILGDPSNFVDNNPEEHPIDGNILGTVYKGGVIVPFFDRYEHHCDHFRSRAFHYLGKVKRSW